MKPVIADTTRGKWIACCLDVWLALGGTGETFNEWMWNEDKRRTLADAWAQLMAAVRGDIAGLCADSNPPAGSLLDLLLAADEEGQ